MTDFSQGMIVGGVIVLCAWAVVIAIGNWLSGRELARKSRSRCGGRSCRSGKSGRKRSKPRA